MKIEVLLCACAVIAFIIIFFLNDQHKTIEYQTVLISIVTIDRDAKFIDKVYQSIEHLLNRGNVRILIICRETDTECIRKWKECNKNITIIAVPHYEITKRHNINAIAIKRNIARQYAIDNGYDYLLFVDSDIIIQHDTLNKLLKGCANADVCLCPYKVRWFDHPAIGVVDRTKKSGFRIKKVSHDKNQKEKYSKCAIGGMGCTLLNKRALEIPFEYGELADDRRFTVYGEDIGYFINAHSAGIKVAYLRNHTIDHL